MKVNVAKVWVDEEKVNIQTKNGIVKSAPIVEFRLLRNATPEQRQNFEYGKFGIRWEELDEDLSFEYFFTKEELKLMQEIDYVLDIIPVSYIAKNTFGKSRSWLHNKLNGNLSNGKPASLTLEEIEKLSEGLEQMSAKINEAAVSIAKYVSNQKINMDKKQRELSTKYEQLYFRGASCAYSVVLCKDKGDNLTDLSKADEKFQSEFEEICKE